MERLGIGQTRGEPVDAMGLAQKVREMKRSGVEKFPGVAGGEIARCGPAARVSRRSAGNSGGVEEAKRLSAVRAADTK